MGTAVVVVGWGVALALSVALVGVIGATLGVSREFHPGGVRPSHRALNVLALLFAVLPLGLVLWAGQRRFLSGLAEDMPLGWVLPGAVGMVCGVASLASLFAGERLSGVGARAHARRLKTLVSKKAAASRQSRFAGQVVVMNPASTAEDMQRCRAYIESRTNPQDRWSAFWPFIERGVGWKTWNPREVGLSSFWDARVALTVVRHDQEWFLRTFFESMFGYRPTLPAEEVRLLRGTLRQLEPASGWSLAAIESLRARVLPEMLRRLEPRPGVAQEGTPATLAEIRERLTTLITTGPRAVPPVPSLDAALPADAIGLVRKGEKGALEFWMRATESQGEVGDVYFRHEPGTQFHFQWSNALAPLEAGQVRPVPPQRAA